MASETKDETKETASDGQSEGDEDEETVEDDWSNTASHPAIFRPPGSYLWFPQDVRYRRLILHSKYSGWHCYGKVTTFWPDPTTEVPDNRDKWGEVKASSTDEAFLKEWGIYYRFSGTDDEAKAVVAAATTRQNICGALLQGVLAAINRITTGTLAILDTFEQSTK